MDDIPIGVLLSVLAVLLVLSGFFSMAETSMMALNRFRLKHWVAQGHRGAKLTQELLEHTDRLLGVLLLGNNFINAASAAIVTVLTVRLLGKGEVALTIGTILVTLAILIFSEITPKIEAMAGGAGSAVGTGGMATKIVAAKIATAASCNMIIAKGTENHPLQTLMDGGKSTLFLAKKNK